MQGVLIYFSLNVVLYEGHLKPGAMLPQLFVPLSDEIFWHVGTIHTQVIICKTSLYVCYHFVYCNIYYLLLEFLIQIECLLNDSVPFERMNDT